MTPKPADLPPVAAMTMAQIVAEVMRIVGNVPAGYGGDYGRELVTEWAARQGRYGRRKIIRMYADINALRTAIRAHDVEAAETAWDAVEEHIDVVYGPG